MTTKQFTKAFRIMFRIEDEMRSIRRGLQPEKKIERYTLLEKRLEKAKNYLSDENI
jgi:hypothetical protein